MVYVCHSSPMKTISTFILALMAIGAITFFSASPVAAEPLDARGALINALSNDQLHRSDIKTLKSATTKAAVVNKLEQTQERLDQQNINTLNRIIEQLGHWPGVDDVGENPAKIAMILFKRSTVEQQKSYLPLMLGAAKRQGIPIAWYTEAYDHHLMRQDLPQKFGHLLVKNENNAIQTFYPFSSLNEVEQNRKEIGLPPLKQSMGEKNKLIRTKPGSFQDVEIQTADQLMKMSELALKCLDQTYPNSVKHVLNNEVDAQTPDELYPAFFGCFDWHSSVHGHWLLVRVAKLFPNHPQSAVIKNRLAAHFTTEKLQAELIYFQQPGRAGFERPYGLAWYLQLYAELHEWQDPKAQQWLTILKPLKDHIVHQLSTWIPKLAYPIRTGEHSQTAFAFGLALDYAQQTEDHAFADLLIKHSKRLYLKDTKCPINYEPSGQDFLSACLAEADLMRRFMDQPSYTRWLKQFLPSIKKGQEWLPVAKVTDRVDGKLAHLDGLNIARAWMLEGMASALPNDDRRRKTLLKLAHQHAQSGLAAVTGEHYAGGHWLGSFATYYLSQRGLGQSQH